MENKKGHSKEKREQTSFLTDDAGITGYAYEKLTLILISHSRL